MKSIRELFDFGYFTKKGLILFYAYMAIYVLYAFTTGLEDILLALSIGVFIIAPLGASFLMFVFYLLWEYETTFSFGVTVVLIMQLLMVAKILMMGKLQIKCINRVQNRTNTLQTILLIYVLVMGVASLALTGNMTGIGMAFKAIITFYVISYLKDDESYIKVLKAIFHALFFSTIIATIYGFFHDTALERWVSGLGEVSQLYGTLGTTSMGFFYIISMAYFLYFVESKIIRYAGIAVFSLLTFMTVSLTAVALYLVVIALYFFSLGKIRKTITYFVIGIFALFITFPIWSRLDVVEPILLRATFATEAYEQGDANLALSGREDLGTSYMKKFENSNTFAKLFGNADEAVSVVGAEKVAHNTYIDILFYFGIFGLVLFALYHFRRFTLIVKKPYFYPLLTMKAVLLLGAFTVSIMSATYFFFLIFV